LCRVDLPAHDPRVLADLPPTGEPVLLEELDGRTEEKPRLSLASGGHLRDRLDQTAAGGCDVCECALEPCAGDSVAAMVVVDDDAGGPAGGGVAGPSSTGARASV